MMRKKILTLALFVGAMLLLTATGALTASAAERDSSPTLQDESPTPIITPTLTVTNPVAIAITEFFSSTVFTPTYTVTLQTVLDLHGTGMGYGEIARCFFVARFAGVSPDEILEMRQGEGDEKAGWGVIMGAYGFRPGKDSNLGAIRSGRVVTDTQTVTGTLQITAKPGKGPKGTPPGWEHGKGLGRHKDKNHGRGHNK